MKALRFLTPALLALFIASCGGKKESTNADITPEVKKFYAETKNDQGGEFFSTKDIKDLPADLKWEDGADQQEYGSPNAKKGGTFHEFLPDFPRTLRTIGPDAAGSFREYLLDFFQMPLVGKHPNTLKYIPCAAKQWATGADKKTFYFRLDPDARFSDGEKVTADNYFFAFFFMRYPDNQASWNQDFYKKKFENITKYDDHTISIRVASAKPDAMDYAAIYPIPINFYKHMGKDFLQAFNWKFAPTLGAYIIKEADIHKGQSITLTRQKDWWAKDKKFYRQLFNPDRIELEVIRDPDKAIEVFKTGGIDAIRIVAPETWHKKVPDDLSQVEKGYIHKVTFYNQIPRPAWGFWINTAKPPLDNRDLREGLQYACNWDLVCKEIFFGDATRLPSEQVGFGEFTDTSIKARPFDPGKAAEFFAKAGFKERGPDGVFKNAEGKRLSFTITNPYRRIEPALVVIQQEAKKAGVEFNIETLEPTEAYHKIDTKKHELAMAAFNTSVEMYPRFWETWHGVNAYDKDGKPKEDTNNFTSLNDKELNEMIDRYDKSESVAEIKDLAWKMEKIINDSAVFIPGWQEPYYRCAFWRWLKWPEHFDSRTSRDFEEGWAFWLDDEVKKETQEAMKSGKTFPKEIKSYDQWREKP